MAKDGPLQAELFLNGFTQASDLIAGQRLPPLQAELGHLNLQLKGLRHRQRGRSGLEETAGPMDIIVCQLLFRQSVDVNSAHNNLSEKTS